MLAPLAAVAVVAIVIALLIVINGHDSHGNSAAGHPTPAASTPAPGGTSSPTKPARTSSPAKPSAKPKPKPKPSHSQRPKPVVPTAMAPVQVLNNSRRSGLAHQVAAEVEGRGWQVSKVGNLQGRVAQTTVYFASGDQPAAVHLAHEFSSIRRIEPNARGRIHAGGLTLVLTRYWAR